MKIISFEYIYIQEHNYFQYRSEAFASELPESLDQIQSTTLFSCVNPECVSVYIWRRCFDHRFIAFYTIAIKLT